MSKKEKNKYNFHLMSIVQNGGKLMSCNYVRTDVFMNIMLHNTIALYEVNKGINIHVTVLICMSKLQVSMHACSAHAQTEVI